MKLSIIESEEFNDVEITIRCRGVDKPLERIIEQIRLYGFALQGKADGKTVFIHPAEIYYFESVDEKTFIYCKSNVYGSDLKLYEIEERLSNGNFSRISKSVIINICVIKAFKGMLNGKMEAVLDNGEKLIVSRHYVSALKNKLDEMGEI